MFCNADTDTYVTVQVHWQHIEAALGGGHECDGTVSFPDLGYGPYNGSTPIIMYDPQCGSARNSLANDFPHLEPAMPADSEDPYLRQWIKTRRATFNGVPCSFPGGVWKSAVGNNWNMICAYNGDRPWARYTTSDPCLLDNWTVAAKSFTQGVGAAARCHSGALFHKIPNAVSGGPSHLINADRGQSFYLGNHF